MTTSLAERKPQVRRVQLEDLRDDYLECRDLRHAWRRSSQHDLSVVRNTSKQVIEFTRIITCARCGAERHQTYSVPSMEIVRSRYVYPQNYLLLGSHSDPNSRVDAVDIRKEVFKRVYARIVQ